MFADYTKLVLLDYEKKRAQHALSSRLSLPTTAKLREECMDVCIKRYTRKDARVLNDFFGGEDDQKAVLKKIEKYDADKLKPLLNFINRKTKSPDTRVIELLAWLIDFEPRPFQLGKSYALPAAAADEPVEGRNEEEQDAIPLEGVAPEGEQKGSTPTAHEQGDSEDQMPLASGEIAGDGVLEKKEGVAEGPDQTQASPGNAESAEAPADPVGVEAPGEQPEPEKERPTVTAIREPEPRKRGSVFKRGLALFSIAVLALAGFWIYQAGKKPQPESISMGQVLPAHKACMYWAGDHYEQIACTRSTGDTLTEPLDPEKIRSFKKITRPDTITRQSKGSVWYVKINGGKAIEFYTSDGFHPIDRQRRLKPVTDYIIEKYIHPESQ